MVRFQPDPHTHLAAGRHRKGRAPGSLVDEPALRVDLCGALYQGNGRRPASPAEALRCAITPRWGRRRIEMRPSRCREVSPMTRRCRHRRIFWPMLLFAHPGSGKICRPCNEVMKCRRATDDRFCRFWCAAGCRAPVTGKAQQKTALTYVEVSRCPYRRPTSMTRPRWGATSSPEAA